MRFRLNGFRFAENFMEFYFFEYDLLPEGSTKKIESGIAEFLN